MNLLPEMHRIAEQRADWERVAPDDWNVYQRIAAATHGTVTPGNAVTLLGATLSVGGLMAIDQDQIEWGLLCLAAGRYCDVKDGDTAERTKTKGPFGEGLDASIDNLLMVFALPVLKRNEIVPENEVNVAAGLVTIKAAATFFAKRRGNEIHASRLGKIGAAGEWAAICLDLSAEVLNKHDKPIASERVKKVGKRVMQLSLGLTGAASVGYVCDALGHPIFK